MRRNLFPLLGIAFVVAIAATGIFYGLFVGRISGAAPAAANLPKLVVVTKAVERGQVLTAADVRLAPATDAWPEGAFGKVEDVVGRTVVKAVAAKEAVIAANLAGGRGGGTLTIPKGMRAISVRVSDSAGLIPFLRQGVRIDLQAIETHNGEALSRTLLSNVEILNVHVDINPQAAPAAVLNLLIPAKEVDRVALADSANKVRIVLRSREDETDVPAAPAAKVPMADAGPRIHFQVRMAAAASAAVRDFVTRAGIGGEGPVRIGLLPADWNADATMPLMEKARSLQVLSNESVESGQWQEVSLRAGAKERDYDLRLSLMPRGAGKGTVRVRVHPELTLAQGAGKSSRGYSAELNVADGQSLLVAGFERDAAAPALVEKLFRSPAAAPGSELLMVVTTRMGAAR